MVTNKKYFMDMGVDFSEFSTPHIVAGLLGFRDIHTKSAIGFRTKWAGLKDKGIFKDCVTVGDFQRAYLTHTWTGEKIEL